MQGEEKRKAENEAKRTEEGEEMITKEEEKAINDTLEKLRLFEKMAKKIKREDVVQAALMVERYCWTHLKKCRECDCPFSDGLSCLWDIQPYDWELEEFLRTRGLDDD